LQQHEIEYHYFDFNLGTSSLSIFHVIARRAKARRGNPAYDLLISASVSVIDTESRDIIQCGVLKKMRKSHFEHIKQMAKTVTPRIQMRLTVYSAVFM